MRRVVILATERATLSRLGRTLEKGALSALLVAGFDAALEVLRDGPTDAVVVYEDAQRSDSLNRIFEADPETSVVIVTKEPTVEGAVAALHAGASDYVNAGDGDQAVLDAVERIIRRRRLRTRLKELRIAAQSPEPAGRATLIGESPRIRAVREELARLAKSDATVLIDGESGTGKDLAARILHESSTRSAGPFVPVACAALPRELAESELFGHVKGAFTGAHAARKGVLEQAHQGTLLLDDIAQLPREIQAKLLRALQERKVRLLGDGKEVEVDVRIVASTNVPLASLVRSGTFREDLYYRLNVLTVHLPPLRQRDDDVLVLAHHFISRMAAKIRKRVVGVTPGAAHVLSAYDWPGNVRELRNWMEAAVVAARFDHVTEDDLPLQDTAPTTAELEPVDDLDTLQSVERDHIAEVLRDTQGNKSRAAKILGLDRKTLYRKIKSYRLDLATTATQTEEPENGG